MPVPMTCHSPKTIICHSPKMKKVHFYIFTFLQRNTYLNGILNKEGNMECYIIIIIYYIIIYYNIIYNNFINGFLETLIMCKNPFLCKNVKCKNVKMPFFEVLPQRSKMALQGSDRVASPAVEWIGVVWWCTPWRRDVPRVRCWYVSSDLAFSMRRCSRCRDNTPGRVLFLLYKS